MWVFLIKIALFAISILLCKVICIYGACKKYFLNLCLPSYGETEKSAHSINTYVHLQM